MLSGANIMSPGLTSAGGHMDDVPSDSVIAIMAEGKEHALAIGVTTKSTEQIRTENKACFLQMAAFPFLITPRHPTEWSLDAYSATIRHSCIALPGPRLL